MSIDISQFHDVFFEESFESLDTIESDLLNLVAGAADINAINTLFRSAHSIKGAADTFGFMDVAKFTHVMETLLDDIRYGEREVTAESTNLLLDAVDVLREMLTALQQQMETDDDRIATVRQKLEAMMAGDGELPAGEELALASDKQECGLEADNANGGWRIDFRPHRHLFQTGNDPVCMFHDLASLGDLSIEVDDDELPPFYDLEPENSYFKWILTLRGDVAESDVMAIFEGSDEYCDLVITPLSIDSVKPLTIVEEIATTLDEEGSITDTGQTKVTDTMASTIATPSTKPKSIPTAVEANSIRVNTDKVDSLLNMVGELVISQSMLSQIGEDFTPEMLPLLIDGLAQLERSTREVQQGIMGLRMLPISFAFNRLPRLVHDMTDKLGKKVALQLTGEQIELDKTVLDKIGAPLEYLVRNALDHGLETPAVRVAAGKNETGMLQLKAFHQGSNIVIEIHDDGTGLNEDEIVSKAIEKGLVNESDALSPEQIQQLIFVPNLSTGETVSNVFGCGVGIDVVRKNISSLGGTVKVFSKRGQGCVYTIFLPITSAIIDGQTIRVADEKYIIPLIAIIETLEIKAIDIKRVSGQGELYKLADEYLPIIRLYSVFNFTPKITDPEEGVLVIVEDEGQKVGLFIDALLGQQHVVIKRLETNYRKVIGVSGVTILGDGSVALIIDVPGVIGLYRDPSLAKMPLHNDRVA